MNKEKKIKRLKTLINSIDDYSDKEYNFNSIEKLLKKEIQDEENENSKSTYLSSLKSVVDYELPKYKATLKKRPKKGAIMDYNNLVVRFGYLVTGELTHLELSSQ